MLHFFMLTLCYGIQWNTIDWLNECRMKFEKIWNSNMTLSWFRIESNRMDHNRNE